MPQLEAVSADPRNDGLFPSAESLCYEREMVLLDSSEGQRLLQEAVAAGCSQHECFAPWFEPQQGGAFCGIASAVGAINSLHGRAAILQKDLAQAANSQFWTPPHYDRYGLSLDQVAQLVHSTGLVTVGRSHTTDATLAFDCLGETLPRLLSPEAPHRLVCNFWRDYARHRGGHFCAVVAFAPSPQLHAGHVLLMDPQQKRAQPHWLPLNVLCVLMQRVDRTVGLPRGFLVLSSQPRPSRPPSAALDCRVAAESEIGQVRSLLQKAFAPVEKIIGRLPSALTVTEEQLIHSARNQQLYVVSVLKDAGPTLVATFTLFYRESLGAMFFCQFAVDPDAQSLGLGSQIVEIAEALALKKLQKLPGVPQKKIALSFYAANTRLFTFYTRLGFIVVSVGAKSDTVLWRMTKDL